MYTTSNGGTNWNFLNPSYNVADLCFVNLNDGWSVDGNNGNGMVYNTTNGAGAWSNTQVTSGYTTAVDFVNSTTGWVVGNDTSNNGHIWKSLDGGADLDGTNAYRL